MNDRVKRELREWIESLVIAVILALVIRTFVVQAFKIPTGSMRTTLLEGDRILVNKFLYKFQEPKRGDVIVFKYPGDMKKDFIKRLIATEGEEVEIKAGDIYINGERVEDPFIVRKINYYNKSPYGEAGRKIKVPEDSYFVLGDNSASSKDSRYWGFVPEKNLIGKAFFLYWPLNRIRKVE
ncbi:MAG: signal peptidase I [Candidatus Omnitrophota bacterium]